MDSPDVAARSAAPEGLRQVIEGLRREVGAALRRGESGLSVTEVFAAAVEAQLVSLFESARRAQPAARLVLVGLGGLGRRELYPHSDIDVLLVADNPEADAVRAVADAFFYPLWDARLEVGHGVRSVKDFARLVAEDETVRTGAIDSRALAGDERVGGLLRTALDEALASRGSKRALGQSLRAWLAEEHWGTMFRLEPDLKTGPGGLRDVQRIWWASRLVWNIAGWEDLAERGVEARDQQVIAESRVLLSRLRAALHTLAGRKQDIFRFDLQDGVAELLAEPSGQGLLAAYFRQAALLRSAGRHVFARCLESLEPRKPLPPRPHEDFSEQDGELVVEDRLRFERDPIDILRLLRLSQRSGLPLATRSREAVLASTAGLSPATLATPEAARLVVDLLSDVRDGGRTLELCHELGVLGRIFPELEVVRGLAQRDTYHTYTVDAHLVYCARLALDLLADRLADAPGAARTAASRLSRPHLLVLAALLHDIGKGEGRGHAERGALIAIDVARRLRLDAEDERDLEFLVREHLTMFKISQRRDLEDPELIGRFAHLVESRERLDLLLALSVVDALGTGKNAWSPWKAELLEQFYGNTLVALRRGAEAESLEGRAKARRDELHTLLGSRVAELEGQATRLSERHLVAHPARLLIRHLEVLRRAGAGDGTAALAESGPLPRALEVVVAGPDRPGLLADLCGALAAHGLSVDAAYISATLDGLALDSFIVLTQGSALQSSEGRGRLAQELEAAVRGDLAIDARLAERRRAQAALGRGTPEPERRVTFDEEASTEATVLDVFAPDRVGLLYDIARAIFAEGVSIALARVSTEGERAIDAFYLVDGAGRPLDGGLRARVAAAVGAVL